MIEPGATLTLEIEKATAGGRMLARHHGQVVLVWGAIPGERVEARVARAAKGVVYAEAVGVSSPSPDRRSASADWRCGGNVFAHVDYTRQLRLKAEIIQDAFGRIGRLPLAEPPSVMPSPEQGYRMRARLHARSGRLGFYREGSHDLCDPASTRQLLPSTNEWIAQAEIVLQRERLDDVVAVEIAENITGDQRACHVELRSGGEPTRCAPLSDGLVGLSASGVDDSRATVVSGTPAIHDDVTVGEQPGAESLHLRRHVRAFFQGNRFLIGHLVRTVIGSVPREPVIDLYAGGGLLGLALAATGVPRVTLVEGDPVSGADLDVNAAAFPGQVSVERRSVESYMATNRAQVATVLVDPPRTGMSREALGGVIRAKPQRVVYVSCDVPTLARDARGLVDAGYQLERIAALDLFPNTAHVESVAVFDRSESGSVGRAF
jgi:23S rRNA (uracil1939-C5)-methyltransferase